MRKDGTIPVRPGIEVFLRDFVHVVKRKKVGLLTNPTGVDSRLESAIDLFCTHPDINITALFGPEHGVSGSAQAGENVPAAFEKNHCLPVFSLYRREKRGDSGRHQDMDENMRLFDTQDRGKSPENEMLENVDVLVIDLQDVGTRVYTYIATMAFCMIECAPKGIELIILDRPNPINGLTMEGPLLDDAEHSSFVGMYPIPVRHGLTIGELALFFNAFRLESKADLTVIPTKGWKREMWFDETGLPWIAPSPNMPTLVTASVYPGQVFLEGTNLSEGRGTALPFELFGAPWINGRDLARKLNRLDLPGVAFRETSFRPFFSKFEGQPCQGCQIHIRERRDYRPLETALFVLKAVLEDNPENFAFHPEYFDAAMGTNRVRKALMEGKSVESIVEKFAPELKGFENRSRPYLLY
jgi:uncharacterized protein YbbC (DUF1343 family)